jgi:hypothetical protein
MLVASAAKTGLQFGKSKVTLAAQDKGSGHLTQWYKSMGFTQNGVNQRGYPQLEAPISRVLAGVAQAALASSSPRRDPRSSSVQLTRTSHSLLTLFEAPPMPFQLRVIQAMDGPPKGDHEDICETLIKYRQANKILLTAKLDWRELEKITFAGTNLSAELKSRKITALANFQKILEASAAYAAEGLEPGARRKQLDAEAEAKRQRQEAEAEARRQRQEAEAEARRKREEQEAERIRQIEASQEPKARRRLEAVARLLENPENICVALAEIDDVFYAATNQGGLAPLEFNQKTLWVSNLEGWTGKFERARYRDASKVSDSINKNEISITINKIIQVGQTLGTDVHAELKLLDFLSNLGIRRPISIYISKLCCEKCRIAIDLWNTWWKTPCLKIETPNSHGDYFPGWELPPCIHQDKKLVREILTKIEKDLPGKPTENARGRTLVREDTRSQRRPSVSPPPREASVREWVKPVETTSGAKETTNQ